LVAGDHDRLACGIGEMVAGLVRLEPFFFVFFLLTGDHDQLASGVGERWWQAQQGWV